MADTMIVAKNEYGLAEAAILSEPWLSTTTLPDVLARPAVVTAAVEEQKPILRRVLIRKRGPEWHVEVSASDQMHPTFLKSVEAVAELLRLPPCWNSYSAKRIAPQNAARAIRLLGELLEPQTLPPAAVPRVQGGIQLEWHSATIDIEVYIEAPHKVSWFAENIESGKSFEGPLVGSERVLKAWVQSVSGR